MDIREQFQLMEEQSLSPFATLSSKSKGRAVPEKDCQVRTPFQRDRDRILHCNSFRRLMNKTQVFLNPQGDHYRTRLTHSLEVGQIARTMARALRLNEDLAEAISMGHDLGHTPFGHSGEYALRECSPIHFVHGEQSVRIVEMLERNGRGLNLTAEVINGIMCHSDKQPWADTPEGKVVRFADKFAYIHHDTHDALRAGIITESDIPHIFKDILGETPTQRLNSMILSVIKTSKDDDICMDGESEKAYRELRAFLFDNVYINSQAKQEEHKAKEVICSLYKYYCEHPQKLPGKYLGTIEREGVPRAVVDYISGMSDRYCVKTYSDIYLPKQWGY